MVRQAAGPTGLAESAFGAGMPELMELETIYADEVGRIDGVQRESVSNRGRGDQEIHGACSFASTGSSYSGYDITVSTRCQAVEGDHGQVCEDRLQALHAQRSFAVICCRRDPRL